MTTIAPVHAGHFAIDRLEQQMREEAEHLIEIPAVHHFADGLYAREITIPAGALVTGKIHKTRHLNVVSAGRIAVYTEREGWREIRAPFSFVAEPGTRRVGFAIEDTTWTTVHATHETDLDVLERELIAPHDSSQMIVPPYISGALLAPVEAACPGSR